MAKHGWKGFGIHPHIAENQPHEVRTLGMNHPVCYLIGSLIAWFLMYRSAKSTHQLDDFDPARPCQREDLVLELHRHRHPEPCLRSHRAQSYRFITEGYTTLGSSLCPALPPGHFVMFIAILRKSLQSAFILYSSTLSSSSSSHFPAKALSVHPHTPSASSARADEDDG